MRNLLKVIPTLVITLTFSFVIADDELIKYTDANGRSFYVDSEEKVPSEFKTSIKEPSAENKISRVVPGRVQLYEKEHYKSSTNQIPKIEIFVARWCSFCRILEKVLLAEKIPFKKYDIELDGFGQKTYRELGGGIPLIRIDKKKVLHGYSSLEKLKANF